MASKFFSADRKTPKRWGLSYLWNGKRTTEWFETEAETDKRKNEVELDIKLAKKHKTTPHAIVTLTARADPSIQTATPMTAIATPATAVKTVAATVEVIEAKPADVLERFITYKRPDVSDHAVALYCHAMNGLFNSVPRSSLAEYTDVHIQEYKTIAKANGLGDISINTYLRQMRTFFAWAKAKKYVAENPMVQVKKIREQERMPGYYSGDQRQAILAEAERSGRDIHLFCALCSLAGTRPKEALNATWGWCDFEGDKIRIQGSTKSRKVRIVPMSTSLKRILLKYKKDSTPATELIIKPSFNKSDRYMRNGKGSHWQVKKAKGNKKHRWTYRRPLDTILEKLKLDTVAPHGEDVDGNAKLLRHTFASYLTQQGVPLQKIMEYMGHSKIEMTLIYAHLAPAAKDAAFDY